jgi:hypothetical protein
MRIRIWLCGLGAALCLGAAAFVPAIAQDSVNDYPTAARADYVFGCMAANGQTQDALLRCSCSIDVIASIVPYDEYEAAATVLSMRQVRGGGEKMTMFRDTNWAKAAVEKLRRAQVEADLRCF